MPLRAAAEVRCTTTGCLGNTSSHQWLQRHHDLPLLAAAASRSATASFWSSTICHYWLLRQHQLPLLAAAAARSATTGLHDLRLLLHHCYADDTQMYFYCRPSECATLNANVLSCIDAVADWMTVNKLRLNPSKVGNFMVCYSSKTPSHKQGMFYTP